MRSIETNIDIAASPAEVWQVLTDLPGHSVWNPFMPSVEGAVAVGERLRVVIAPPGRRAMTVTPTVTTVEPERCFEWLGHLGPRGLFDGRHRFELHPNPDGSTRLVHAETFTGLLVPALWRWLRDATRAGFEEFNQALAERCEQTIPLHDRHVAGRPLLAARVSSSTVTG